MPFRLEGPSQLPRLGGKPTALVIMLHGYGASGDDLIGLAPYWANLIPKAEFIAPNGPYPCDMMPMGRQWFGVEDMNPSRALAAMRGTAPFLDAFLDEALAERGLDDSALALVGFSQGTMMALHVGLRRAKQLAGILGFSGALLGGEALASEIRSRPPVLLAHGDADPVLPFQALAAAQAGLAALGVPVETMVRPGLGHEIDEAEIQRGGAFLRAILPQAV
jgi:phospholipase/carboxylesterase